ncbi:MULTISPECIES: ABC transporter permease [unclassified Crossiella]|uniref:ABC transporter permease n=1 Tax=unclassified Crossiella TaxID=2620835 RepID=UPI00200017D7|nr:MULTISPECIES: ABC transporter permease [unclassified Crossiella]MCK2238459.1 ABC transporter permease [Crossiella sp. S99.2]MCK2251971.1 ABC transporter permease [Crossiella sp. S99.1]
MRVDLGPSLAVVLLLLTVAAAAVVRLGGLGPARPVLTAAARAVLQLTLISLVLLAVLRSTGWTALFITVMCAVAVLTSARRLGGLRHSGWLALAIAGGALPVLILLVLTGIVPPQPIAVLPTAGILIGGAMTATSLAGRRARHEWHTRHGEYEAALALGLPPRDAVLELCRPTAGQALLPALDQTRTVGLVTLPGAFVGMLLGGATPLAAGATQLVVLIGLLAVEAIAVLVTVELIARGHLGAPQVKG